MKIEKSEYQALLYQLIEQQTQIAHLKAVTKGAKYGPSVKEICGIFGWPLPEEQEEQ